MEVYLAMPHIFRNETEALFTAQYAEKIRDGFDGILVRNLESIRFLERIGFDRNVITDHNLYVFNRYTKQFWKENGIAQFTVPLELNRQEIKELGIEDGEMVLYGNLAVMISAQCVEKTTRGCRKKDGMTVLTDRYQNQFAVRNRCRECYNVIYNSAPLYLLDLKKRCGNSLQSAYVCSFLWKIRSRRNRFCTRTGKVLFWESRRNGCRKTIRGDILSGA